MTEVPAGPRLRPVAQILESQPTIEGAGVHLRRAFGHREVPRLDPFLLLDDFRSENPAEYVAGFPWHPHRGIETVTYMIGGKVEHADSLGNRGTIGTGDLQWMTSGSGIIHQEMPKIDEVRRLGGFQLWVNMPSQRKMSDPRYQEIKGATVPWAEPVKGARLKVLAGEVAGVRGPVQHEVVDAQYYDVTLAPGATYAPRVPAGHTAFAYVLDGRATFDAEAKDPVDSENLVIFGDGDAVRVHARDPGARFLFIAGRPLREPVAWWGPIVMNNRRELEEAVTEFQEGTFVKKRGAVAVPGAG